MSDLGAYLTEKRMKELDKRLQGIYSASYKQAVENNKKWIKKLSELPEDTPKQKRISYYNEVKRTSKMIDIIASDLANTGELSADMIEEEMLNICKLNYDFTTYSINSQSGLDLSWINYDKNQLKVILLENVSPFTKIAYNNLGKKAPIVAKLNNHLAIATINGESQQQIMKRIKRITNQNTYQARRVAQTERTRVQSQGRHIVISEAVDMGIKMNKQWVARMVNTRDLHEKSHMEIVSHDELFGNGLMYPGDPNGRAENVINCHCYEKPMVDSISPSLSKHRKWAKNMSFDKYQQSIDERKAYGNSTAYEER